MRISSKYDAALNDSSKSWTVPDGEIWTIDHVYAILTSTATAGNRQMVIKITDGTNQVGIVSAGAVQAATNTYAYDFFVGAPTEGTVVNNSLKVSMPLLTLLPGYVITVEDDAEVAAAADDLTVAFTYQITAP